jgi:hypothetical protein
MRHTGWCPPCAKITTDLFLTRSHISSALRQFFSFLVQLKSSLRIPWDHAMLVNRKSWDDQIEAFAQKYQVVRYYGALRIAALVSREKRDYAATRG